MIDLVLCSLILWHIALATEPENIQVTLLGQCPTSTKTFSIHDLYLLLYPDLRRRQQFRSLGHCSEYLPRFKRQAIM